MELRLFLNPNFSHLSSRFVTNVLTNATKLSYFWEVTHTSHRQKVCRILWNAKIHELLRNSAILINRNQSTDFHPTTSRTLTISSALRLGPSFIFSNENFVCICCLSHEWCMLDPPHPWFYYRHLNNMWPGVQIVDFRTMTFCAACCYVHLLTCKLSSNPQPSLSSSWDKVLRPYKNNIQSNNFLSLFQPLRNHFVQRTRYSGYLLAGRSELRIPAGAKDYIFSKTVHTGSGAHPAFCSTGIRVLSWR
jgi:hypothetical protein